ncbi:Pls/PosA family non-ribosomal peptide synthetase [Duganella phyllosphaerae]|uniref:Dimodular nonribosomal peptide synthase n=1 Tax=Duganella phyllosphaerae TaxID=762836 RepID=A0A1E7WVW1_9BURK|nr:Pls/PosA family non-ribosomal peptide synthetase [Duganella phyllosphaerae]OFA03853.1 dimodular nonribosomal peptide synthase [Duganella phyllosphaerae]
MTEPAPQGLTNTHPDILFGPSDAALLREEILADLLEASAARAPDHPALVYGDVTLSYRELDARAALVAARLIAAGVRPGQIVGLWLPRGIDLLVAQAGIAKAGAAWLPVDEDTPVERLQVCLIDADGAGVVTSAALATRLAHLGRTAWTIEALLAAPQPGENLAARGPVSPDMPAYVIYTSGSTGKPKGILITQRSICHFLRSENAVLQVTAADKVYQGFSVAFDMSFEEIWISYLAGATLWIGPKEISGDPETLPRMLDANQVTVLHAVPTLLALFNQEVPSLRLINLGGEACPESLVERWSRPGRQMFNTYGPTEATVSASLARLRPGHPVTIGTPLPNYGLFVIDPNPNANVEINNLRLLPIGEVGELCITGPGLAAGYLGRPDLTAEKFLPNPWSTGEHDHRLYRTGDLARIGPDGEVTCLGRADDQVKIRGFRVELGEIEALLAQQPGVGTVAVLLRKDDGIDQLVAYLVPEAGVTLDPKTLRSALAANLPPYMVPGRYEMQAAMPRLTSGKIDRKALKALPLSAPAAGSAAESDLPETPAEAALFAALATLFPGQAIVRQADFFSDLGGHSFFAARLASTLRADPRFAHMTVRDIYQQRQVGKIAQALADGANDASAAKAETEWTPPSSIKRWTCGLAQAAAMPGLVALRMAQWLAPFFTYHFFTGDPGDSVPRAIAASVGVFLIATVLEFAIAIAGKWLIAGRLQAGEYPLWSLAYYRWWLADRLVEAAPVYLLAGSSLNNWWLRALGAKIGKDVIIGSMTLRAPDLLTVGDYASIGNAVNFENARVERGVLKLGRITLERDACVSSFAVMEGNTRIEAQGHLEGQSALGDGAHVPAGRIWAGSPAADVGAFDPARLPPRPVVSTARSVMEGVFFVFGILLIVTLFFMPVFPSFVLIDWFDEAGWMPWLQGEGMGIRLLRYFVLAFPASAVLIVLTALLSAGIRWTVLPRLKPGRSAVHSNTYCAKWLVSQIQESSLNVLHGIYATVFAPYWYRLLGAKVGKDAEISTALGVVPDMLTLGDETFIADAVMLGDEEIDGGWMTMQPTVISNRSFVGNGAYIPDGTVLPEQVLIGVHSRAPGNARMNSGDTWLGSPPLNLPAREQTSGYPESLTFHPSPMRRLGRGLIEAFRIVAPHALVIAVGYTVVLEVMPAAGAGRWGEVIWDLTLAGLVYGVGNYVFVVLLKWLLIGRYRKQSEPMWTPFVWLSEGVTNLYEGIAVPNFMRYLRGTPWLPLAFNLMGAKIGKGVYLDTTDITEFDCVRIGDHSELNALTCPQTHLFEDRVMKIDQVTIGERVYLGPRSAVLYSAVVGRNARLGALTLVMKGEHIPANGNWAGCPAAPAKA